MAQQPGQKSYGSSEEASLALVMAAQKNDGKALLEILGPDGKNIVSSGDATEDANDRAIFVEKYHEMNRLVKEPDGTTTLYIGAKNWPTPIPLVDKGGAWFFDTQAGKKEILYRRIGQNETSTIRVCQDLVIAQQEYFSLRHGEFAQAIFSDEGRRNGLYWKSAAGEPQSPLGPWWRRSWPRATSTRQGGVSTPYCGYYFRILTRQGKHAQGGAKELHGNRQDDERFRHRGLPGGIPVIRRHDLHRGPTRRGAPKGPGEENCRHRQSDEGVQPRIRLGEGRRSAGRASFRDGPTVKGGPLPPWVEY
jgi:hypothetical protein